MLECIIGIRGAFRAGKDTVADIMLEEHDSWAAKRSFASNLRDAVALIFGFDPEYVYTGDFKESVTHVVDPEDGSFMTGRRLLQYFGSDVCRHMDPDCWSRGPITWFYQNEVRVGIIPDVRFPNEIDAIRQVCCPTFIVKVERPGFEGDNHISERALDDFKDDDFIVLNNGSLEDLREKVIHLVDTIMQQVEN